MIKTIKNGIINENPIFVQVLGMCPTLAVTTSLANGIGMGLGFTIALSVISAIREILGNGTILGMSVGISAPATIMLLPPGGFLTLGLILGVINVIKNRKGER